MRRGGGGGARGVLPFESFSAAAQVVGDFQKSEQAPAAALPRPRWPSPFSNSSYVLSRLHSQLGLKELCFFRLFAASTEF